MTLPVDWPEAGRYILAVSGGADSMTLLDLLASSKEQRGYDLVVAHFDHGIRPDSRTDRQLVEQEAGRLGLPFVYGEGQLGKVSEDAARRARRSWLEQIRAQHRARAVVTAHHQDDVIETSLLNVARGSGRRGLSPMRSGATLRPLIGVSRKALRDYAADRHLQWNEDPTNADISNPRNFLRHKLLPSASPDWRVRYLELVDETAKLNKKITQSISAMLQNAQQDEKLYSLPREVVKNLSLSELSEVIMAIALSLRPGIELDRRLVDEMALFAVTGSPGRRRTLRNGIELVIDNRGVEILAVLPATNASS